MATSGKKNVTIETVIENLVDFSIDREDLKALLNALPKDLGINTVTLDYELQILKIISVGWSISVYLENHPEKNTIVENFWIKIREFSQNISNVTSLTIGHDIDYFKILKERFEVYVKSLSKGEKNSDPVSFIGPAFAEICKNEDNPFITITGARVFNMSITSVKEYFDSIEIE